MWAPDAAKIDAELLAYRGGWFAQQAQRTSDTLGMHTTVLSIEVFWQSAGIMLLGMALYHSIWSVGMELAGTDLLADPRTIA